MPPAKHILCIYLPHWAITRRFRRYPQYRRAPVAVIRSTGQRRLVIDVSPKAQSQGLRPGMSAAEARALCAKIYCIDEDIAGDHRALNALGRWLMRFTPVVSSGWDDMECDPVPAALFLDLTGSERLFGGIDRLMERVRHALSRFEIPAHTALAPTPGAAWALALTGGCLWPINDLASLLEAVSSLPAESLRLNEFILNGLHQLGLHRVENVLTLPREQLPSRFGTLLSRRLDQLTGILPEPLTKLVDEPPITARMGFVSPIESLEDIQRIFEKLLNLVIAELNRKNRGARQMRMTLKPDRGWGLPIITRTIALGRARCDRRMLLELIRGETERVDCEHGFVRFQLDVPLHEPIAKTQAQLFDQQSVEDEMELDRLLQRLQARAGEAAVIHPRLVESYLPERAWKAGKDDAAPAVSTIALPPRPLTLFPLPLEVRVICEPSDDRTGRPRQFSWRGNIHRLVHAAGPERIAGEWWRGHRHARDYYETEDDAGRRFWLCRVLYQRGQDAGFARWFLHGQFD